MLGVQNKETIDPVINARPVLTITAGGGDESILTATIPVQPLLQGDSIGSTNAGAK